MRTLRLEIGFIAIVFCLPATGQAQDTGQTAVEASAAETGSLDVQRSIELAAVLGEANTLSTAATVLYVLHVVTLVVGVSASVGASLEDSFGRISFSPGGSRPAPNTTGMWYTVGILGAGSIGLLVAAIICDVQSGQRRDQWRRGAQGTDSPSAALVPFFTPQGGGASLSVSF